MDFINEAESSKILADQYSVIQIISHLIDNAIKYTIKGRVAIRLYNRHDNRPTLDIKDTGIGISKKYMKKLFEPFTQQESGYTRSHDGNGLGLALVKKYCELNNAVIKVFSEENKGSTFSVIFPNFENQKKLLVKEVKNDS